MILKKTDTWKIQLTIAIDFISCKDIYEECVLHSRNVNMESIIYDNSDKVIEQLF